MNDIDLRIASLSPKKRELLALKLQSREARAEAPEASSGKQLVAYVLPKDKTGVSVAELRAYLREKLPEYMVPSAFVLLDELPLTASGKLDVHALPAPTGIAGPDGSAEGPRTPAEEMMMGIWCDVLGATAVGVRDSFFDVGGHSLLAVQIVSRIREVFGADVPLRSIFEAPTIAELTARVAQVKSAGGPSALPPILPEVREGRILLSYEQQALWLTEQVAAGSVAYNMPAAIRMRGKLDVALLEQVIGEIVKRHESLRTTFALRDGEPVQVISPYRRVSLPVVSLHDVDEIARESAALALVTEDALTPFDLAEGPLFRARLIRLSEADHLLITSMHHIISDGWSMSVFNREIAAVYEALSAGRPSPLSPPRIQYADYALWQRGWLRGEVLEKQLAYWRSRLAGAPAALDLPTDRPRPAAQTFAGALHTRPISREVTAALRALGRRRGATLFMVLSAAFKALLYRYTHQTDLVIGTPIANRSRRETEDLIGYFVNTIVFRTDLGGDPTFTELLARVKETALGAYAHQDVPFELVVEAVQPERDPSRSPIFQVMCELQNLPSSALSLGDLSLTMVEPETRTAKFDLLLVFTETPDDLKATFEFSTDLFEPSTIARMADHLDALLSAVAADPSRRISAYPILSEAERGRLLVEWNRTDTGWSTGECFHEVFEAEAERSPGATAVVSDGRKLTYAELNLCANRVAHALAAEGLKDESVIAVLLDRGIEFLAGMIGVFKAGCAYVPLDPALPRARLEAMLSIAGCRSILTDAKYRALASELAAGELAVLDVEAALDSGPKENPGRKIDPRQLSYLIFTSGSTGTPKGAMIEHRGMLNHLRAKVAGLGCSAADCLAQTATQSFDVSVWQFLTALLVGGRVSVFKDENAWEPQLLLSQMARDGVTIFETVPTHTTLILDELERGADRYDLSALRWFVVNGEPLLPELCARWFSLYPGVPMINAYGPTECSDDIAHYVMRSAPPAHWRYVPISGTLPNLRVYVLDRQLEPVPIGVTGELCVGGIGVGRGYIGDPEKTAAAFVPDPFSAEPGARMYRTGDNVRCREDGTIEFLGRIDHQVKVRGYRIEIGEIESALADHPAVREGVVVVRGAPGSEAQLVAYVSTRGPEVTARELADHLRKRLASYMVPSAFVLLPSLPLLPSGKVDRKSLPEPTAADAIHREDYTAPRTPVEALVASAWSELLSAPRVSVHDNFFELGGHSLVAIRTISRIRSLTGVELSVRTLFERPTVAGIAAAVEELRAAAARAQASPTGKASVAGALELRELLTAGAAKQAEAPPHYDLAPYQLPEWYMHELEPTNPFYNVTITDVMLVGDLDVPTFARVWQALVERHAIFRARFDYVDYEPVQRIVPRLEIKVEDIYVDRTSIPEEEIEAEIRKLAAEIGDTVFDFAKGPIFRIKLAELPGKRFQILFVIHHIVWDETSTMNLAREMAELYNAYRAGREPRLPALELQYPDFASAIKRAVAGGHLERQRQYWLSKLSPPPPALDLPTDFPRPAIQTFKGTTVSEWIPVETYRRIDEFIRRHKITLNIFFLTILELQLHRISGQTDFVIGTPIANRDDERLEPLLGLFATAMPMRCTIAQGTTFAELLRATRETAIEAYDNHLYPSVLAIQEVNPDVDFSRNRLFSVMFGVQNNKTKLLSDLSFDGLELQMLQGTRVAEFETSKFDLTVVVDQLGEKVVVQFNFNTDLFKTSTMQRMLSQLCALAEQAIAEPDLPIGDYRMVSAEEQARILETFNATSLAVDRGACIHGLIEEQAARTPSALAVVHEDRRLTYGELDRAANRLARHLVASGAGPEERVAVILEPSIDLVVTLLAVFKAGAAYVPVMPAEAVERRNDILARSGSRIVVTTGRILEGASIPSETLIRLDRDADAIAARSAEVISSVVRPESLAYIIFTSGTTGLPKGIQIEHRGIVNLIASTQRDYGLGASDRVLWLTPVNFDASVLDLFWPLAVGAAVVVPPASASKHPARIGQTIAEHEATAFQCVPLMLEAIVEAKAAGEIPDLPSLRLVICGGAALGRKLRDRFRSVVSARLCNHYGPTEVTVDAARLDCDEEVTGDIVPIGRPIANTRIYILDAALRPVPIGVTGEIYVSSPGLARGYLGDPERTAASFVPDPHAAGAGARMYRTGDLGRYREDGTIEFIGRADKQVKIRGNRVELEEIQSRLMTHPGVGRCAVQQVRRGDSAEALVAHVELRDGVLSLGEDAPDLRLFTLAQRPELRKTAEVIHADAWPAYFAGDCTLRNYWTRLSETFPECQFMLVNASDEVVAVGNAIPVSWDGHAEGLPAGWDAALEQGFIEEERGITPNTFLILTGVVARGASGRGLATAILRAHKSLAHALGYERVVVPVRPTSHADDPRTDFEAWFTRRRADGKLEDNWLRVHERVGGKILRYEGRSQHIRASVADWEGWAGRAFPASGEYLLPDTLQPVYIDRDGGYGEYYDPCIWVEHPYRDSEVYTYQHVDAEAMRAFMRNYVPDYMIPEHFRILGRMPLTSSGKIDEGALSSALPGAARERAVPPQNKAQKRLADIWAEVLAVPTVGVTDDFFELGGHSIRAVEMLAKVADAFKVTISLRELFLSRTIKGLEKLIVTAMDTASAAALNGPPPSAGRPVETGLQSAVGTATAHHGEIFQGVVESGGRLHRALVTLPCGILQSEATFTPDRSGVVTVEPRWKVKACRAAELALEWAERRNWGGRLEIRSNIPVGWGLGSSTGDVIAAIRAVAAAAQKSPAPEVVAKLAVASETASDSIMFGDRAVLFAQREGVVIEDLGGPLPPLEVLGFNTDPRGVGVDTVEHPPARYSSFEIESFRGLRGLIRRAIRDQDPRLLGRVATASARISQRHLPKPNLELLEALVEEVGAVGLQVAHSGTVVGLLFDANEKRREDGLRKAKAALSRMGLAVTWQFRAPAR